MRNMLVATGMLVLSCGIYLAQVDAQTPYEIALQRIEEARLNNATSLNLEDLSLTELPPEIAKLSSMQELSLAYNDLTILPAEIGQLSNLITLDIRSNQLSSFSLPSEITQLSNLQSLRLANNLLITVPTPITQLDSLLDLDLEFNQLRSLPPEIGQLHNLVVLNISSNQLTNLPSEMTQLSNLQSLQFAGNLLTTIPLQITQLPNLLELNLAVNQITNIPPEIGQLSNLTVLHLEGNQLASLSAGIGQLTNLQELWVQVNNLTSLPPEFGQLSNLCLVDLSSNYLQNLPVEMGQLDQLAHPNCFLYLAGNPLVNPPEDIVEQGTTAVLTYLRNQLPQTEDNFGQVLFSFEISIDNEDFSFAQTLATPHDLSRYYVAGFDGLVYVYDDMGRLQETIDTGAESIITDLAVDTDGTLYIVQQGSIYLYDAENNPIGEILRDFPNPHYSRIVPRGDGTLYATQFFGPEDAFYHLNRDGIPVTPARINFFREMSDERVSIFDELVIGQDGFLYYYNQSSEIFFQFTEEGEVWNRYQSLIDTFSLRGAILIDTVGQVLLGSGKSIEIFGAKETLLNTIELPTEGFVHDMSFVSDGRIVMIQPEYVSVIQYGERDR